MRIRYGYRNDMMHGQVISRLIRQQDGHIIVRYWTPREYTAIYMHLQPTEVNERIDLLNSALYCEALKSCKTEDVVNIKAPHTYGIFQI